MNLLQRLRKKRKTLDPSNCPTIVVFAGGMGTQIIQAAAYFSLKQAGHEVYGDVSYFDVEARMAQVGEKGRATHWFWQLDQYGLTRDSFEVGGAQVRNTAYIMRDGLEMMQLGLQALGTPEVQQRFMPSVPTNFSLPEVSKQDFLCIHIRRGDYVNVASHLVSDKEFLRLGRKFSGLIRHAVLVSDSPFETDFKQQMDQLFQSVSYLDKLDPYSSHWLMRQARILVCSNSTYSLTAALLNPKALVVMPKRWFGPNDQPIEAPIQELCSFQVMS